MPVVAILVRLLAPTHFVLEGWRWVMLIGALGAALAWYFRRALPESPRWLESHGRHREAEAIVATLEASAHHHSDALRDERRGRATPISLEGEGALSLAPSETSAERSSFAELWREPYRNRTLMLVAFQALQTIGYYGFANWAPTFLLQRGVSLLHSLDYALLIALVSPLGPALAAITSDRLERKWTIVAMALLMAGLGLGFAFWSLPLLIILSGALLTLCGNWFSALFHAYQAELFPTRLRATGVGFTYSWSRLSAALSSLLIGAVLSKAGVGAVFALLSAALCGVAGIIAFLGPRTNRISLEVLSK